MPHLAFTPSSTTGCINNISVRHKVQCPTFTLLQLHLLFWLIKGGCIQTDCYWLVSASIYLPDTIQLIPSIFCSRECCSARYHLRKNTPDAPNRSNTCIWQRYSTHPLAVRTDVSVSINWHDKLTSCNCNISNKTI